MCRLIVACAVMALATLARAEDKPRVLTGQDVAAGRLMLFDGVTTFGWQIDGEAAVKDGWLVLGGKKASTATCKTPFPATQVWLELDYQPKLPDAESPRITFNSSYADKIPPLGPTPGERVGYPLSSDLPVQIRLSVPAGSVLRVGDVLIDPFPMKKLFTGKNLDGWKVNAGDPKRMASKFEVTRDGEVSVKNGPGDLVTEKEFDNFVLQFECKTLGKGLNSGIFFRCIPGQYQNGYEAQIQNLFKGDDRTKPVDFGTGAIYRRIPARKVVSNDNEWFTMTVAAHSKHIATWVNGYQTVDWVDERPADENPRKGYRAAKGPISIQGHDPTTDLLFRNIRIAELPAK